jgi:hypothetical protein
MGNRPARIPEPGGLGHTDRVQITSQCHVDAPVEWVRTFLLAGTTEDDVTVEGDVVEVRQRDRLIDLVVRNTLSPLPDGGTQLDVDARLRLLGMARLVGGIFRGRVRRTLESSLERLPAAIERALAVADAAADHDGGAGADEAATHQAEDTSAAQPG